MQSVVQLQKKVQALNDEIKDILHATELNLTALAVQLAAKEHSKPALIAHANSQRDFVQLQQLLNERSSLRLDFLITEQVKEEEAKVRRQRLVEYEEKIYDQRRLISDKEAFYEALLKPRRKRPPHITPEEFQAQRKQELLIEERKNLRRLDQETAELRAIEKTLARDNAQLEKALAGLKNDHSSTEQLQWLASLVAANPLVYQSVGTVGSRRDDRQQLRKVLEHVERWEEKGDELRKEYLQERELEEYLRWQHHQLREKYSQLAHPTTAVQPTPTNRPVGTQNSMGIANYRLKRSCSV